MVFDRREVTDACRSLLQQLHKRGFLLSGSDPSKSPANPVQPTGQGFGNPQDQYDRAVRNLVFGPRMMFFFDRLFANAATHFDYIWFQTKAPEEGTSVHCDIVYMRCGTTNIVSAWTLLGNIDLDLSGLIILENSYHKHERLQNYLSKDVDEYCVNYPNTQQYASARSRGTQCLAKIPFRCAAKPAVDG